MNNEAALALLTNIANKGIEIAVKLGRLDPATATDEQIEAAATAAIFAAMEMEPLVAKAMQDVCAERLWAMHNAA